MWYNSCVTSFWNRAVTARFFAVCCRMPIFRHRQIAGRFSWPWTALSTGSVAAWRSPPGVRTVIGRTKLLTASFPGHYPTAIAGGSANGRQGSWRSPGDVHKSVDCRPITVGWSCGHRQVIAQSSSDSHPTPPPPKYGHMYKSRSSCFSPAISAAVTMLRRHEFERQLAHFNILCGVATIVIAEEEEQARRRREEQATRRRRRWWVRPWLSRRPIYGHYEQLMNELLRENHTDFKNFLHVEPEMFFELVERVGPRIQKNTR